MSDAESLREIEEFFHRQIPLTRAMALHVEAYDRLDLFLTVPIEVNRSHRGTAFSCRLSIR